MLLKTLGFGATSKVVQCLEALDDGSTKQYAMKVVDKSKMGSKDFSLAEYQALKQINHPHIIRLHEIIDDSKEPKVYLVMDQLPGGTLLTKFKSWKKEIISTSQLRNWLRNLASALHFCHVTHKMCHLDIKPDNVMLDAEGNAVLCDFGNALLFNQSSDVFSQTLGTPKFFAPEQV